MSNTTTTQTDTELLERLRKIAAREMAESVADMTNLLKDIEKDAKRSIELLEAGQMPFDTRVGGSGPIGAQVPFALAIASNRVAQAGQNVARLNVTPEQLAEAKAMFA